MGSTDLDLALMVFAHTEGAERAYADAPQEAAGVPWAQEVAFVEHHGKDRIVVRGEVAGRYVDVGDDADFIGRKTVEGALTGAVAGAVFGPPGFAAGMVGGGVAGSIAEERSSPPARSALLDEVRSDVPEGSSAVLLLAAPQHVDAMVTALEGHGGRLVRRRLTREDVAALQAALAGDPPAASSTAG
ncbi:MAG: DUF1269 domain-containing protein [Solirubrobacteraceae bacterium]